MGGCKPELRTMLSAVTTRDVTVTPYNAVPMGVTGKRWKQLQDAGDGAGLELLVQVSSAA